MMYPDKEQRAALARPDEGVRAYVVPGTATRIRSR